MRTQPENRDREFNETTRIAEGYLNSPHSLPKAESLNRWRFLLRLWHYPAFDKSTSWGVYQLHERGSRLVRSLVRQVTWDRPADCRRLSYPLDGLKEGIHVQPTIEVRDRPIETMQFEKRLEALTGISFPAFASSGFGIDGEIFGVAFPGRGPNIEWWCEGPESWRELTAWADDTRVWLTAVAHAEARLELWLPPRPRLP